MKLPPKLRSKLSLWRVNRQLRCPQRSPQAREMLLVVMQKRASGKELPRELIKKAKAIVGVR